MADGCRVAPPRGPQRRSPDARCRAQVFGLLQDHPGVTARQIIDRTGLSPRTVQHYLQVAREEGITE